MMLHMCIVWKYNIVDGLLSTIYLVYLNRHHELALLSAHPLHKEVRMQVVEYAMQWTWIWYIVQTQIERNVMVNEEQCNRTGIFRKS